jgi:ABC-type transport system involved in multi-copper enzyme maturation permease subunit
MTLSPLFGALIIDRDPYIFGDFAGLLQAYLEDAGGFLFFGLVFYFLITLLRPSQQHEDDRKVSGLMLGCIAVAILCYAGYGFCVITSKGSDRLNLKPPADPTGYVKVTTPRFSLFGYTDRDLPSYVQPIVPDKFDKDQPIRQPYPFQALLLTAGGLFSLIGAVAPFCLGMAKLRLRRVWAISILTIKEVIRNKVFLAFLLILIPLMFPLNWFLPFKPEDELKQGVTWVGIFIAVGLLLAAVLLSSFAIPNDVKSQNIYTIVTKPVERFEIVLGRFLGYVAMFTAATLIIGAITLLTLSLSNPSEQSQAKTQTARVPVRGKLSFQSRKGQVEGIDVGREFNYRKYIGGDQKSSQRAVYEFASIPSGMGTPNARNASYVEFTFDIYRLIKGDENKGVDVNIRVVSWQCGQIAPGIDEKTGDWKWADAASKEAYLRDAVAELSKLPAYRSPPLGDDKAANILRNCQPGDPEWEVADKLAEKYGFYEYYGKEVFDFETTKIPVPSGLYRNAAMNTSTSGQQAGALPRVKVFIHCTTPSQMLGMAEGDLYLLAQERSFIENYLKSTFGLWCWLVLVVGLSVTLSTYLDAVVTLLCVAFLFIIGFFSNYILELSQTIGKGQAGPFASLNQLLQAKQPTALAEGTATEKAAETLDVGTGWGFRRIINVLPDVDAFYWTHYVSEGFNISAENLVMNGVLLVAYLFPWFLLAYYLMRGREVAA